MKGWLCKSMLCVEYEGGPLIHQRSTTTIKYKPDNLVFADLQCSAQHCWRRLPSGHHVSPDWDHATVGTCTWLTLGPQLIGIRAMTSIMDVQSIMTVLYMCTLPDGVHLAGLPAVSQGLGQALQQTSAQELLHIPGHKGEGSHYVLLTISVTWPSWPPASACR